MSPSSTKMQSDALLARGGCSWHRSPKGGLAQLRVTSSCSTCTAQQYMQNKRLAQTHFVDLYKAEPFTCQSARSSNGSTRDNWEESSIFQHGFLALSNEPHSSPSSKLEVSTNLVCPAGTRIASQQAIPLLHRLSSQLHSCPTDTTATAT